MCTFMIGVNTAGFIFLIILCKYKMADTSASIKVFVFVGFLCYSNLVNGQINLGIRAELVTIKEMMADVEGKLEQFNTLYLMNLAKKVKDVEAKLDSISEKIEDLNKKNTILEDIQQSIVSKNEAIQRISKDVNEILRKQTNSFNSKAKSELTKLEKIDENIQSLFQLFGALDRKFGALQQEVEHMVRRSMNFPSLAESQDYVTYLGNKMASLEVAAKNLGDCLECHHAPLGMSLKEAIKKTLEAQKAPITACSLSEIDRSMIKILENQWQPQFESAQTDILHKLDTLGRILVDIRRHVKQDDVPNDTEVTSNPLCPDFGRGPSIALRSDETVRDINSPGRIFRKLWRKLTDPVNKLNEKMDQLKHSIDSGSSKWCNNSFSKITELLTKDKSSEMCITQYKALQETTKDTNLRLGYIESRQMSVQNICSKILVEVERLRHSLIPPIVQPTEEVQTPHDEARSCADLQVRGNIVNDVYTIVPKGTSEQFNVYCDFRTDGGGWTVIQRRGDYGEPRENFTQGWDAYKSGFGDLLREFWLGNEKISQLTSQDSVKLRIELEDFDGHRAFAEYSRFYVGEESDQYRLNVGEYSGNATDSLSVHDGKMFSTIDRDNDEVASCCNCATTFKGGWWYYKCFEANLNGPYHSDPTDNGYFQGIIWERWRGDYSLRYAEMKIRPLYFDNLKDP